jgi:hypothetical protein
MHPEIKVNKPMYIKAPSMKPLLSWKKSFSVCFGEKKNVFYEIFPPIREKTWTGQKISTWFVTLAPR